MLSYSILAVNAAITTASDDYLIRTQESRAKRNSVNSLYGLFYHRRRLARESEP